MMSDNGERVHIEGHDGFTVRSVYRGWGSLYRGSQPRGNVEMLRDRLGVTDIVCLQDGWFDLANEILRGKRPQRDELRLECIKAGVRFHEISCSDFMPPSLGQTKEFLDLVNRNLNEGRNVFVHCLHGKDRTGWMCAAFRVICQNWEVERAIDEWHRLGHHKNWYFNWTRKFIKMMREML